MSKIFTTEIPVCKQNLDEKMSQFRKTWVECYHLVDGEGRKFMEDELMNFNRIIKQISKQKIK